MVAIFFVSCLCECPRSCLHGRFIVNQNGFKWFTPTCVDAPSNRKGSVLGWAGRMARHPPEPILSAAAVDCNYVYANICILGGVRDNVRVRGSRTSTTSIKCLRPRFQECPRLVRSYRSRHSRARPVTFFTRGTCSPRNKPITELQPWQYLHGTCLLEHTRFRASDTDKLA